MAKEPYVSSAVYDMTGGLQPAPADDGYNIAMWVNTPCGPTSKTKVLSQKDFIDKYMTGTSITPNDHISAITAYMTLAQNPLYLLRACPVSYLEGISCTGNSYLFDKTFKPLDSYNRFAITGISVGSDSYTIAGGNSSTPLSGTSNSDVLAKIMPALENGTLTSSGISPVAVEDYSLTSRNELNFSENIAIKATQIRYGEYSSVSFPAVAEGQTLPQDVSEGSALNIGDTTAYFVGTGQTSGTYANGISITYGHAGSTIDGKLFLHLVAKKLGLIENIEKTGASAVALTLKRSSETLTLDNASNVLGAATLELINYCSKPTVPTASLEFADAQNFDNGPIVVIESAPSSLSPVSANSILFDGLETKLYKVGETSPSLVLDNTSDICYVNDADEAAISMIFLAKVPMPSTEDSTLVQQIFALTFNEDGTAVTQLHKNCSTWDEVLDFFIMNWPAAGSNLDVKVSDGKITLWNKATAPFASNSTPLKEACVIDGDTTPTYHYQLASDEENASLLKHNFLWLQVNDTLYYSGTFPDGFVISASTQVQLTPKPCTSTEFKTLLEGALYLNQQIGKFHNFFVTTSEVEVTAIGKITLEGPLAIDQSQRTEQFAIVQAFPTTESLFQYSYELDRDSVDAKGSIYNLHLNYKNGEIRENWTISFNPGKTDGYGVDQWYNRVQSDYFKIVSFTEEGVLGDIQQEFTSQAWGRGASVPEYNVQYAINAMQTLPEYEDGVSYHVLSDAGVANTTLASTIETLAEQLHSVYLASLPEAELNVQSLIDYVSGAGLKSFQTRMLAAGDRININGFSKILPGSYKLILQYIDMFRNKGAEFAPNFGLNHGVVGVSNLVQAFSKPERERLLDFKIESLKGGVVTEYYINRNDTAQKSKTYMSEDQNVRMTNIAVHLCEDNLKQYIGELNTAVLRDLVQTRLTAAIQDRLFKGKTYTPAMYRVVCDDSNNPISVIEQNQLVVSLYASFTPSIQYVLVDHFIVPLSQVQ